MLSEIKKSIQHLKKVALVADGFTYSRSKYKESNKEVLFFSTKNKKKKKRMRMIVKIHL